MSAVRARRIGRSADHAAARKGRQQKPEPKLKVVEETRSGSSRLLGVVGTMALLTLFVSLFGMAAFHAVIVQGQDRIDALDNQVVSARSETQRLRLQLAELLAPDRIVEEAKTRLGMVEPPSVVYLTPTVSSGIPSTQATAGPIGE